MWEIWNMLDFFRDNKDRNVGWHHTRTTWTWKDIEEADRTRMGFAGTYCDWLNGTGIVFCFLIIPGSHWAGQDPVSSPSQCWRSALEMLMKGKTLLFCQLRFSFWRKGISLPCKKHTYMDMCLENPEEKYAHLPTMPQAELMLLCSVRPRFEILRSKKSA